MNLDFIDVLNVFLKLSVHLLSIHVASVAFLNKCAINNMFTTTIFSAPHNLQQQLTYLSENGGKVR